MASHDQQIRNPRYRDWVKAGLALKYLKDGIEDFVNDETKEQQKNILQDVQKEIGRPGVTCNSCPIDQLRAYKQGRYKKSSRCPNDVCDRIFDKIAEQHFYGRPSWSNTDSKKWCTDHWEIAKCFVDGGGYGDKTGAVDTDCKGLLSIITNNMFVHRNVDTPIDRFEPKTDVFSKSKEARNEILHLASLQLPVQTLKNYVNVMIQILEDKGRLHKYENSKQAISKLSQLKETELYISTENEWEIREAALKAVQERKQDALDEIEKKQKEILEKLQIDKMQETIDELSNTSKETSQSFSNRHESLEQKQILLESTFEKHQTEMSKAVKELQQDVADLKKGLSDLKAKFDAFDEVELQHKKRITYLEHKKVLRQELFNMYSKYLSNIQVPPLLQKLDATVDEFYIELKICDDLVYEKMSNENHSLRNSVTNYHDFFYKEGKRVENIYVLGDAGVGKTTWCLKLIAVWLQGLTRQETEAAHSLSLNKKMMLEFDFVLYISLRHASKDVNITDMVRNQIFHQTPQLFEYIQDVMNFEPDKCLVIADGLDEWNAPDDQKATTLGNNPSFPGRKNMNHCTVLTTTRPWKLNEAQPSYSEIDRAVIIQGFGENYCARKLAEKVIQKLNQNVSLETSSQVKNEKKVEDFVKELKKRFPNKRLPKWLIIHGIMHDDSVTQIPLILILMVVKWFNDGCLESTMAGNYSFMLKSLFEHEEGYRNIKPRFGRKQKLDGRLSCIRYIEEAKREWSTDAEKLPECVRKHAVCCQYSRLILKLSEIAFEGLFERNSKALIFSEESLLEQLSSEEVEVAVKSGILSKSDIVGHCNASKLSFLHKTVQEFLAAIHLVSHHENDTCTSFHIFEKYCSKYGKIDEMENVILFISGLDANLTVKVLRHVAKVENQEMNVGQNKMIFTDFVVKCIKELRKGSSVASMQKVPLNSFAPRNIRDFDELLDLLGTSIDKGSIKYVEAKMCDQQGLGPNKLLDILFPMGEHGLESDSLLDMLSLCYEQGPKVDSLLDMFSYCCTQELERNRLLDIVSSFDKQGLDPNRLLDILSSELSPLFSLTTLKLEHISGISLRTRTNKRIVFNLHNLRNLKICNINTSYISKEVVFDFSHSKNIESVHLDSIFSCHFDFSGTNLKDMNLEQSLLSHVMINAGGESKPYSMEARIASLTLKENRLCSVCVDPNIRVDSVVLINNNVMPSIVWKEVKRVVLKCVINRKTIRFYIDVLNRIRCSQNLTSLHCFECSKSVISALMETVKSAKNLNSLGIINVKEMLYICRSSVNVLQIKHLALKGSCIKTLENENEEISKFSSFKTVEYSNHLPLQLKVFHSQTSVSDVVEANAIPELPHKGVGSVRSLVNLNCLKCVEFKERDFIMLGECFPHLLSLEELELSHFWWNEVENRSVFSCLKKIKNLKKLSLRELGREVISSILVYIPILSLSEIVFERCLPNEKQSLNNMKMLKKLTFTRSSHNEIWQFVNLMKNLKQIESLIILKPVKYLDETILQMNQILLERIDLSNLAHLKNFLLEDVHISPYLWQKFVSRLPNNGQLETLEFPKAVIRNEKTEQMIKSTSRFVCHKWECVGYNEYNIILKASEFVIYDRIDFKERKHPTFL